MELPEIAEAIRANPLPITDHADEEAAADYGLSAGRRCVGQLAAEENAVAMPFDECPVCGGKLVEKDVEKLLRGGVHIATVTVRAEVCSRCGERLYSQESFSWFDESG